MYLKQIEIVDFLSVKGRLTVDCDKRVTIFLGSNDHGKSNILSALERLNDDAVIREEDANWDAEGTPSLSFVFTLSEEEAKSWKAIVDGIMKEIQQELAVQQAEGDIENPKTNPPAEVQAVPPKAVAKSPLQAVVPAQSQKAERKSDLPSSLLNPSATTLTLTRSGLGTPLQLEGIDVDDLPEQMQEFISDYKPRVELFRGMTGNLQDSAGADEIGTDDFEFLQGVFFYAGLDPRKSSPYFSQDDKTMRVLDTASKTLDQNLRSLWGQGTDLHFELRHKAARIEFLANDPSIASRKARMSKRSAGVTQFFRVSMILYARRRKSPANSYIYLFDEPGVYLHPQGQRDLLQVFEKLADESQIIYATHSLFLLNQNFPERHRLIRKDKDGTKVDQKPYRQNWKLATDALGVYLTSNILFANKVLLVEGDSDPLYIYELFRELNKAKQVDVDLNTLGIMSFGDYKNLRFLLQVFKRETEDASVLVLVDGDSSGKATIGRVAELCKRLSVPTTKLQDGRSIEDYCLFEEQFLLAVLSTMQKAFEVEEKAVPKEFEKRIRESWEDFKSHRAEKREKSEKQEKNDKTQKVEPPPRTEPEKGERITAGRWFRETSEELLGDEASKVLLARNYVNLCRELRDDPKTEKVKDAKYVCQDIAGKLALPPVRAEVGLEGSSSRKD